MEELSTQEYNELYKKYFKEIFSKPMKDLGFKKKGTGKFCRLNKLGLFEYIGFFRYYQKLRLEYAIIPIYSNMMKNSIGNGRDTNFVDLDSEEKMEKGMKEILNEIENSIIPWFQKYENLDIFFEEKVENEKIYFGDKIYTYLFRAFTFAKFKKYEFLNDILEEITMLEKKLKEGKESLKKYIEEMKYNSLLDRKMEKLLKNKAKFSNNRCCKRQRLFFSHF